MSDPNQVSGDALEDYARSIVEPGSSQETSLQRALVELHNLSIPHLPFKKLTHDFLGRPQRQDIFYKLFLMINSEVDEMKPLKPTLMYAYKGSFNFSDQRPSLRHGPIPASADLQPL